jgi:hypothetical protein
MTTQNIYSMKEVATILKTKSWRIAYLLTSGKVEEPTLRLAGRRVFTVEDMQRLSEALNDAPDDEGGDHE